MASLNKVLLIGNLTRDPELRYIPSGTAVATFTLACNRNYKLPSGEKKEETSFIRVVTWARVAEICGEYLKKGSPVFVEGRLQSRAWETPDKQKRSTIEVNASNVQFLNRSSGRGETSGNYPAGGNDTESSTGGGGREPLEEISLDLPPDEEVKAKGGASSEEVPF